MSPYDAIIQSITTFGRVQKPTEHMSESAHVETEIPIIKEKTINVANGYTVATPSSGDAVQGIATDPNLTCISEAATQQFSGKKFTRPQSSDGNLSSGFTFEKALGLNCNMGRNFGSTANIGSTPANLQPALCSSNELAVTTPGPAEFPIVGLAHSSKLHQSLCSSDQGEGPEQREEQEQEDEPQIVQPSGESQGSSEQPAGQSQSVLASAPPQQATELPKSQDNDLGRRSATPEERITKIAAHEEPTKIMSARTAARAKPCGDIRRPMKPFKPIFSVRTPSPPRSKLKVAKSRYKTSKPLASTFQALGSVENKQTSLTDEELLAVLLSRYKLDKQARDQERAAHATEVQDLKDITNSIWEQLQESLEREKWKGDQLTQLQDNQPKLVEKLKKFYKYVEGLNRDHEALRDGVRAIKDGQSGLQQEKERLFADVDGIRQVSQATLAKYKAALNEARSQISQQSHTLAAQEVKIKDSAHSLHVERSRNDLILAEIGRVYIGHQNFAQASAAQGSLVVTKLNDLVSKLEAVERQDQPGCYTELKAVMGLCSATIDMLKDSGSATSEAIQLLGKSIKVHADGFEDAIQACRMEVTSLNKNPEDLVTVIKQDIRALCDNIKTERSLTDQISEHCTVKAVLEEKINSSEAALQEARQSVAAAQDNESTLKQRIAALELEAVILRKQPHESPETLDRLRDIDTQNQAIRQDIERLREANIEASMLLQKKLEDVSHLQLQLEDVNHHLAEERAKATQVANEHTASLRHLTGKHEGEKADLAAKFQLDQNLREAANRTEVEKCKERLAFLEAQITQEAQESEKLRHEKAVVDGLAGERLSLLAELQKGKEAADNLAQEQGQSLSDVTAEVKSLRAAEATLERLKEESDTKLEDVRHSFRKCIYDLKEAEAKIERLEVENTKRVNETREANEARQTTEDLLATQIQQASEAHQALEDLRSLHEAQGPTESAIETRQGENGGLLNTRRKADRSHAQTSQRIVEDSQLQPKSDIHEPQSNHFVFGGSQPRSIPEPLATNQGLQMTDSSYSHFSFAPEETAEDALNGSSSFEDLFPRTPDTGSQALKRTVSFVEDSFGPTNQLSPSRGSLGSDFLEVDLEYLPQPAKRGTSIIPQTPRGPPHYSQTATVSPRNLALTGNLANDNDSQAMRTSGLPRGILKTGRSLKRTADTAGLTLDSARAKGNGIRSESQNSGPAIPGSQARSRGQGTQSQSHNFGSVQIHSQSQTRVTLSNGRPLAEPSTRRGRPAKKTAARTKTDKMTRYFSQEMEKDSE